MIHKPPHASDTMDRERISGAFDRISGQTPDDEGKENALLYELEAAVQEATAALDKARQALDSFRGAHQGQEGGEPMSDDTGDAGSQTAQGFP